MPETGLALKLIPGFTDQFHYVSEGGVTYMVMAEDAAGRRIPFGFLAEVNHHLLKSDALVSHL